MYFHDDLKYKNTNQMCLFVFFFSPFHVFNAIKYI